MLSVYMSTRSSANLVLILTTQQSHPAHDLELVTEIQSKRTGRKYPRNADRLAVTRSSIRAFPTVEGTPMHFRLSANAEVLLRQERAC